MRENGTFYVANHDAGRNRNVRVPVLKEELLHRIEETPSTSTQVISRDLQVSHMTVWRVLREQLLYPYHIQSAGPSADRF